MYHHELSVYHYKLQCSLTVAVLAPDAPSSTGACRYPRRQASGPVVGDAASSTGRDAGVTTPAPASNHGIFASTLPFPYPSEPHAATVKGRCPASWRLWLPPVTYFSPAGGWQAGTRKSCQGGQEAGATWHHAPPGWPHPSSSTARRLTEKQILGDEDVRLSGRRPTVRWRHNR